MKLRKYTPEIIRFIKRHYKKAASLTELCDKVNAYFGTDYTYGQITHLAYNNGLRRDKTIINPKPLYAERKDSKGYPMIKTSMTGLKTKMWVYKHIYIWEQAHGKAPKGHNVIFLDGNKSNCELDNLAMLSKAEAVKLSQLGLRSCDKNVTLAGIAVVRHLLDTHNHLKEIMGKKAHHKFVNRASINRIKEMRRARFEKPKGDEMKVLSVMMPWPYLIMKYGKDVENRTWKIDYRGRILIHASKKPDPYFWDIISTLNNNGKKYPHTDWDKKQKTLCGCIIGSVEIVDCVKNYKSLWATPGMWHWVLRNPVLFDKPIPAKGSLGLWDFKGELNQ